jgi:hypothetical protein
MIKHESLSHLKEPAEIDTLQELLANPDRISGGPNTVKTQD